jgi:glutamine amidotransferase-like uncharacterized protein
MFVNEECNPMRSSSNVFIYNGIGSAQESVADLNELFTSENIFSCKPDISISDFNFNIAGLAFPTFIVPGGSTTSIGYDLKPTIGNINSQLKGKFNYVGVCAGAFIGTNDAYLFSTKHIPGNNSNYDYYGLSEPALLHTTKERFANLDLISDYNACGSFYPNNSYAIKSDPSKTYQPYCVNISFSQYNEVLPQLYVAGPGFFPLKKMHKTSEVVASYQDEKSYTFPHSNIMSVNSFPAIIRRKSQSDKGGVFLSGPHIEACVSNSKMLRFFKSSSPQNSALDELDYNRLIDTSQKTLETVESLLKETLSL